MKIISNSLYCKLEKRKMGYWESSGSDWQHKPVSQWPTIYSGRFGGKLVFESENEDEFRSFKNGCNNGGRFKNAANNGNVESIESWIKNVCGISAKFIIDYDWELEGNRFTLTIVDASCKKFYDDCDHC